MVRKKTLSITLLILLSTLIFVQLSICTQAVSKISLPQGFMQKIDKPTFDHFTINQFNESAEPATWFYLNLVVIVLVPIVMIVQAIVDKTRKKPDVPEKLEEDEIEDIDTRVETSNKFNPLLLRIGFFVLFIQNVLLLPMLIGFIAMSVALTVGGGGNQGLEVATMNLFRVFSIIFYLDFAAALLCVVGLTLFSLNIREKIQSYVAAGFWLLWIGVSIYPRINFVISAQIFNPAPADLDIIEFFLGFFGNTTFLLTCGYGALALALFYTAKLLVLNNKLQRGGLLNAFGITNFSIGALANILLLSLLTYGFQLTPEAISALVVILGIFWVMKFLASPILGMVTGIITFNRIGKASTT